MRVPFRLHRLKHNHVDFARNAKRIVSVAVVVCVHVNRVKSQYAADSRPLFVAVPH